jgi:hypothetical protein
MYDRGKAVAYAQKWAFSRNPRYYNFDSLGGDCTNFISQCLFAGSGVMNYTPDLGWFYISPSRRSAAWSGVPYLYNFLVSNKGPGPYGEERPLWEAQVGDVTQLSFNGQTFGHSQIIVRIENPEPSGIFLATHTYDAYDRPLSSYTYQIVRLIHIAGVRR